MASPLQEVVAPASSPTSPSRSQPASAPLPRYKRVAGLAPAMALTARDLALLEDVWRYGVLTTSQLEVLRSACVQSELRFVSRLTLTRRLKLLFHHRYLRRLNRPLAKGSLEPVYVLDSEGARVLSLRHGEVSARMPSRLPKAAALDHLLGIVQVRVALSACPHLELVEWLPGERARFRVGLESPGVRRQNVSLIPDAAFVVRCGRARHYAFLEVDRGTEPQKTLAAKVRAYVAYWKSGGFAHDFSVPRGLGFWVLMVAPSPRRLQTVTKAFVAAGELQVMFRATLEENITSEAIATPVWRSQTNSNPQANISSSQPHIQPTRFWDLK